MEDVKNNIANNIVELRKSKKWTQVELADKLNYTDKAISKWERGESTPDVEVLYQMATLFGVTVDYFFHSDSSKDINKYTLPKRIANRKIAQLSLVLTTVLFIAVVIFVYQTIQNVENAKKFWIAFVWVVPVCSLIVSVSLKKNNDILGLTIFGSILVWSLLVAIYLQFLILGENVWLIFLIGLPLQIAILIGYYLKK